MKFIILLALLVASQITFAQTKLQLFGDLRGRDCNGGMGLCSATVSESASKGVLPNLLVSKSDNDKIVFEFDLKTMSAKDKEGLFGLNNKTMLNENQVFFQPKDLILDSTLLSKIKCNPKANKIAAGEYKMQVINNKVLIFFNLIEK